MGSVNSWRHDWAYCVRTDWRYVYCALAKWLHSPFTHWHIQLAYDADVEERPGRMVSDDEIGKAGGQPLATTFQEAMERVGPISSSVSCYLSQPLRD
jgi:hypothetical protein